jgi:hypothetical protein
MSLEDQSLKCAVDKQPVTFLRTVSIRYRWFATICESNKVLLNPD